ncbi:MAG: tyrosine-type recombinase/integrase [Minisyncoccia bacterium]
MHERIQEYLEWKGTYAHRASINYKIWLNHFLAVCGDKTIEEYNSGDIVKYHRWLEVHYSSYSIQYAMVVLKNLFKFFKLRDCKCLSPELIRLPRIKIKSHRAVAEIEYKKIIDVIPTKEFLQLRDSILIRLLWDTGVRVSELCDLDTSQIDENKTSTIIFTKKTGNKRAIMWSAETHRLLMKYIPMRMELEKINGASALFVGRSRNNRWSLRLSPRTVERMTRHYVDQAGIKERITPHSFRHGWAHKRRDNNAPLAFIQKGLGHSNPISTFVYQQYEDKEFMKNARQYLEAA